MFWASDIDNISGEDWLQIDGSVKDYGDSIADALELLQFCTQP